MSVELRGMFLRHRGTDCERGVTRVKLLIIRGQLRRLLGQCRATLQGDIHLIEKRRNPPGGGSFGPRRRAEGYARRLRLVWVKNPSPQTWSYLCNGVLSRACPCRAARKSKRS